MNEKLLDALLTYSTEKMLKVLSILLWLSFILVSFNKFVGKLDYKAIISIEKISEYFISGKYILVCSWLICLLTIYFIVKYILTTIIPASKLGLRFFFKYLVPQEYKIPLLNVYYKKAANASNEHISKAFEFWGDESIEEFIKDKKKLLLSTGVILKFLLVLILVIDNFSGIEKTIILFAIVLSIIFLLYLISFITSLAGKNKIHQIIEGVHI